MATATDKDKIASLEAALTNVKQQLSDKTEQLDQANTTGANRQQALANSQAALKAEQTAHAATRQELAEARGELAGAGEIIEELNRELSTAQDSDPTKPRRVEHEGITYEVVHPTFRTMDGKTHKAADVVEGSDLLKELVRRRSGVLVAIAPVDEE